jgi:hypothetical protein
MTVAGARPAGPMYVPGDGYTPRMGQTRTAATLRSHPRLRAVARRIPGRRRLAKTQPDAGGTVRPVPYGPQLKGRSFAHAVIVVGGGSHTLLPQVAATVGATRLTVVSMAGNPSYALPKGAELVVAASANELSDWLTARGPADIVVDLDDRGPRKREQTLLRGMLHLRPKGLFVVDRRIGPPLAGVPGVLALVTALGSRLGAGTDAQELPRRQHDLLRAIRRIVIDPKFLLLEKKGNHLVKLRYTQVDSLLPKRSPDVSVRRLAVLPGGTLASGAHQVQHESDRPHLFPDSMPYPEAVLRVYEGSVTSSHHGMVTTDSSILPDSFRHYDRNPLLVSRVPYARNVDRDFAEVTLPPPNPLRGAYFHVDPAIPGHFGHLMGEVVSRLWGWDSAKAEFPNLKALFHLSSKRDPSGTLQSRILGAYGIPAEDMVGVRGPVQVETLVCASALWHNTRPHHVHPRLAEVWARMGAGLTPAEPGRTFERLFVTRPADRSRACRNADQVEELFRQHGFEVIRPEEHPLDRQAELFANASVIAGFGGSALFNLMFARRLRLLIVLNHDGYTAHNEHLAASLLGCEEHFFWSRPEIEHPPGGWSDKGFKSPWEFDFARYGDELSALLRSTQGH